MPPSPGGRPVIAYHGNEPVGYAYANTLQPDDRWWRRMTTALPVGCTDIPTVALKEGMLRLPWRGTGIARRAHDELLAHRSEEQVSLLVNPQAENGKVKAMYESWGYETISEQQPSVDGPVLTAMLRANSITSHTPPTCRGHTMRVGITGHRGLPKEIEQHVKAMLAEQVATLETRDLIGISCIADGPDAWWAQAVLDAGGHIEVVIPAAQYRQDLPDWHHAEYDSLFSSASDTHHTGMTESTSEAHQAGSEILVGLSDVVLAVWDGLPARGHGGTADVVAYAERVGVPVTVLWPDGATR